MKITLLGAPRSTNHIYKYHCKFGRPSGYMSAEGRSLKAYYKAQAKKQLGNKEIIIDNLILSITLFFPTRAIRDIDNYNKIILDSLSGVLYKDDVQIVTLRITKRYSKENPRVEIKYRRCNGSE